MFTQNQKPVGFFNEIAYFLVGLRLLGLAGLFPGLPFNTLPLLGPLFLYLAAISMWLALWHKARWARDLAKRFPWQFESLDAREQQDIDESRLICGLSLLVTIFLGEIGCFISVLPPFSVEIMALVIIVGMQVCMHDYSRIGQKLDQRQTSGLYRAKGSAGFLA